MNAATDPTAPRVKPSHEDSRWELLLLISSLAAALMFGVAAYREVALAPWRGYQREYRAALIASAQDEPTRRAAESFEIRYYQAYLPGLGRVDRCPTCHVGADNPLMKDAPQPLAAHPGSILEHHPVDRFGCTICHGGQGRATEAREAHGEEPGRPAPMRRGEMLQVACALCHSEPELPGMPVYNLSRRLFSEKGCLACHVLRGTGGTLRTAAGTQGPELTAEATKHPLEWHVKHFLDPAHDPDDPEKEVPGSKMPNFKFTEKEARALAYLMMSFTGPSPSLGYLPQPTTGGRRGAPPLPTRNQLGANIDPKAAPGYVGSETCLACHAALNPELPLAWQSSKMAQAFTPVANAPDRALCLECHATGFNPTTKAFAEPNVGCEACHGPGKDYVADALGGNFEEHKRRAVDNVVLQKDRCVKCHRMVHLPGEQHAQSIRAPKPAPAKAAWDPPKDNFLFRHTGRDEFGGGKQCRYAGLVSLAAGFGGDTPLLGNVLLLAAGNEPTEEQLEMLKQAGAKLDPKAAPGYVGSEVCLFCHTEQHPKVVKQWQDSKKAHAFEAVRDVPDRDICLPCHTTGYNPKTRVFTEPNAGCEACHGPGKEYCIDMMEKRRSEHVDRARAANQGRNRCLDCHQVHVAKGKHVETIRYKAAVQ